MKILELKPISGQKSFYKKALVKIDENVITLQSYQTDVAKIDADGYFVSLWGGYSATTQKHIAAFTHNFFRYSLGKKEYEAMELNQPYKKVYTFQQKINNRWIDCYTSEYYYRVTSEMEASQKRTNNKHRLVTRFEKVEQ